MKKHSHRALAARSRRLFFEPLESRALLAADSADVASAVLDGGTLTVQGTSRNDVAILSQDNRGRVTVVLNGKRQGPFAATEIVAAGLGGNDVLRTAGRFTVPLDFSGGPGNDVLVGGRGADNLSGEAGNDVLQGGEGSDALDGGDGRDVLTAGKGNDVATGGAGDDVIHGNEGNDALGGNGGNDLLFGDAANDQLTGNEGNDRLFGGAGNDVASGDEGNDFLDGAAGNDILVGGIGDDRLLGQAGRDLLIGGDGADRLEGAAQDDILIAGPTAHDSDIAALQSLLARWTSNASYAARIASLSNSSSGQPFFDASNVLDDQEFDRLLGAAGSDWFLAAPSDRVDGRAKTEIVLVTANLDFPQPEGNRAVVAKPGVQQMPSVAVNPLDPNHVVIAYMDYSLPTADAGLPGEGYAGIGVAVSKNGGNTWQHSAITLPAPFNQGAAHPIPRFDDQGRVFVTFMAATFLGPRPALTHPDFFNPERNASDREFGFQAHNGIFVARSDNGGLSFNAPVAVDAERFEGHEIEFRVFPDLAIDTFRQLPDGRPNPNYGNMYAAWTRIYPVGQFPGHPEINGGTDIYVAVSRDAGQTWDIKLQNQSGIQVTVIQDPENVLGLLGLGIPDAANITVGPEGNIYLAHTGGGDFVIHRSTDGGVTFANPDRPANRRVAFGTGFLTFTNADPLPGSRFRTRNVRLLAADPARPGTVHAADVRRVLDSEGKQIDNADVIYSHSVDFAENWNTIIQNGANVGTVLNDENDGQIATEQGGNDVISGQAPPRMAMDADGNLAVIWYDTRRDPLHEVVDVFGTVSTDGGRTFTRNFRVTDVSFDADAGRFIDAQGRESFYLGDFIGVALANNTTYAAWTDTRTGTQDIFFTRFPTDPAPAALNDHFEPNNAATPEPSRLGLTVTPRLLPKLSMPVGDQDWFHFEAGATGSLTISAIQSEPGNRLGLELYDATGATRLTTGADVVNASGQVIGEQIVFPSTAGETFQVRVLPSGPGASRYSLELQSLTADLGTSVHALESGAIGVGDVAYYLITAAAAGSFEVTLTSAANVQGNLNLAVVDPERLTELALGQSAGPAGPGEVERISFPVKNGEDVLVRVSGTTASRGNFTLALTNLDQFSTTANASLLFPAGAGPSQADVGDLNGDQKPDLIVSNAFTDTLSVLLGNGNGTFQSPRQTPIGSFVTPSGDIAGSLPSFGRDVAIARLNADAFPDVIVTNFASADVSVLLGRGDGTFDPQLRFDATPEPVAVETGDLDGDGVVDLAVVSKATDRQTFVVATLIGRGGGKFEPQKTIEVPSRGVATVGNVQIARFNADSIADLVVTGSNGQEVSVLLGRGDGTFNFGGQFAAGRLGTGLTVADINADGNSDIVNTAFDDFNRIVLLLGNGNGTFQNPLEFFAGQNPVAVELGDIGSQITLPDGSTTFGPPDGRLDAVVAVSGATLFFESVGPPEIVVLPGLYDGQGKFVGFGSPHQLATGEAPQDIDIGDVNADGLLDVVAVDRDGVRVVYGKLPVIAANTTRQTARDLGTVVHLVQPTQTITPTQGEAWYKLKVPNEAKARPGNQVLDFSGGFAFQEGAGLAMEVTDAAGNVLAAGDRFRLVAAQSAELFVHVFGVQNAGQRGAGAYTLVINVLPQVVDVEAQSLLPNVGGQSGGPTTSLVLTLQGDRLDPVTAEDKNNYRVTWLGADGFAGTSDDRLISLAASAKPVVYSPSTNVEILTGTRFPTAVHQTVTLLFDQPLPPGSYKIEVLPAVQTEDFNADEDALLSNGAGLNGHPVVQLVGFTVAEGAILQEANLVLPIGPLNNFSAFDQGTTKLLSQLHDDLAAILDGTLTNLGDDPNLSQKINDHIRERLVAAVSQTTNPPKLLALWLDPGSFETTDPNGDSISYDIGDDKLEDGIENVFIDVIGNIEIIIFVALEGIYEFDVSDLGGQPRGGYVLVSPDGNTSKSFTDGLRRGETDFEIDTTQNS